MNLVHYLKKGGKGQGFNGHYQRKQVEKPVYDELQTGNGNISSSLKRFNEGIVSLMGCLGQKYIFQFFQCDMKIRMFQ